MTRKTKRTSARRKTSTKKPLTLTAFAALVSGGVHTIAPVHQEHRTSISNWQLVMVRGANGRRTRHLVGRAGGEGRVSSPIVAIDAKARTARSESGREYLLLGESGFDFDAGYVLHAWLRMTGTTIVRDSSDALDRLLQRHNSK